MYQRNFFVPAINLAQKSGMDAQQQNIIFRKYGDFLYQKQDYDGARQQYLKAIDNTEPSQVIRKVNSCSLLNRLLILPVSGHSTNS
jgi:Tfp pilus assembly protein PilF